MTGISEVGTVGGGRVHGRVPDRPSGSPRSRQSLGRDAHSSVVRVIDFDVVIKSRKSSYGN